MEPIVISRVQCRHDMGQDGRVFASTGSHSDSLSALEYIVSDDRVMNFFLEYQVEALNADRHSILRSLDSCLLGMTQFAKFDHRIVVFISNFFF